MSVVLRGAPRTRRVLITVIALSLLSVSACSELGLGGGSGADLPVAPARTPGTVELAAGTDLGQAVQRVQDAITTGGGEVVAVVDHAADARAAGVEAPFGTLVVGGSAASQFPLLRVDQRVAAGLPQRYLLSRAPDGAVTLTTNGADYLAAVAGVQPDDARSLLATATASVLAQAVPGVTVPPTAPLIGVTPANYLLSVFGSADVRITVDRLRRAADRGGNRAVAAADLAAGSETLAAGSETPGPALRPTSVVLISVPRAEAPLAAAAPSIGLDLPLGFVVWLDDQNRTQVGWPDPRRVAARHGIAVDDPNIVALAAEADRLARTAAGIIDQ